MLLVKIVINYKLRLLTGLGIIYVHHTKYFFSFCFRNNYFEFIVAIVTNPFVAFAIFTSLAMTVGILVIYFTTRINDGKRCLFYIPGKQNNNNSKIV